MVQELPQSMSPTSRSVLLASQSPRRRQLLGMIVPSFEIVNIDTDEVYPSSLTAIEVRHIFLFSRVKLIIVI